MTKRQEMNSREMMRVIETMDPKEAICGVPVFEASLPIWLRAFALPNIQTIFYSRRLKSKASISEAVRHEFIHLKLNDGKHGKKFKRACVLMGLNPKNHV